MILILYIIFIVGVLAGLLLLKQKINQWSATKDFERVFKKTQIKLPQLRLGTSYSWPTYDIIFSTKEDLEFAETNGLIKQFKDRIRTRYSIDFDPDRSIYCTYVGQNSGWKKILDEERVQTISWIFLAIAMASQAKPADFNSISSIADGINHAVPTHKELQTSMIWLINNKLIAKNGNKYSLTDKGKLEYDEASKISSTLANTWKNLERSLKKYNN